MVKPLVPPFSGHELDGAVAVVTGAGQGLGRAEALALARTGARVVVNDIGDAAHEVVEEITSAGGEALAMPGDMGDWEFAQSVISTAISTYGDLNVLVNNAGFIRDKMVFSLTVEDWDSVIRVHLRGHAATCNAATAYWREKSKASGEQVWARVINTTSESFLFGAAGQPNYAAAKAGITALTLSVAQGCVRYGVTANAIAPRARTPMTAAGFAAPPEGDEVDPYAIEHVMPVVIWLGTREASAITGQVFVVYGGKVAVMKAPTLDASFSTTGETWSVDELAKTVGAFVTNGDEHGFAVSTNLRI
ncbi:MAG TPA: SDR family NAD(P)-dependent oxidoreductase [Mycobacteriales bacterium]|nr:SDR family NAD(P)-dependent oxidoreductase [Mycobacteriales bacterium]